MEFRRLWAVKAGSTGQADGIFITQSQLAISSADIGPDVGDIRPSRKAFNKLVEHLSGKGGTTTLLRGADILYRFIHEMRIGDHVIYLRQADATLRLGAVIGPYVYAASSADGFAHRRSIRWLQALDCGAVSPGALHEIGSTGILLEVSTFADEFARAFSSCPKGRVPGRDERAEIVLQGISETTNDFIARKLRGELKGYPMEPFVADIFRALGYRAHATRAVRDDGIDVIAHKDELGIEPPIIKIQVKAHEANIGADAVKAFYAMVHDRDVGIFISSTSDFTSGARAFARSKANLKLITGVELINLIKACYDNLGPKYRQLIPLRRILVPDTDAVPA